MASFEPELAQAPVEPRARELWLQHAAGFIFFEDVRRYAMERIDRTLTAEARAAVQKGIDDAVYGLMMGIDGVSGGLSNSTHSLSIDFLVRLATRGVESNVISELYLREGDGMCMGSHYWLESDFGKDPVAVSKKPEST